VSILYVGTRVPVDDQPNVTQRKRSRFRSLHSFSLRTLLIAVTIVCVWLAWQVLIVRSRKAMQAFVEERSGHFTWAEPGCQSKLTWARVLCGDREAKEIALRPLLMTYEKEGAVAAAFPEAEVWYWSPSVSVSSPERERRAQQRRKLLRWARNAQTSNQRDDAS